MLAIALAVLGAIGSVIGIWAFLDARSNERVKLLAWEVTRASALATASKAEGEYKLSILYERPGEESEVIEGAYATYVRFANFGKEAIRREDIALANPLRINVEMGHTGKVLDVSLSTASRDVIRLGVGSITTVDKLAQTSVEFDFLDYLDGGVVRILSSGRPRAVKLTGDIIGMPAGLTRSDVPLARGPWGKIGFGFWLTAELAGMGAIALLYRRVTGGWADIWILALPPLVFCAIGGAAILISESVWPTARRKRKFPTALALPRGVHWAMGRVLVYPDDLAWDGDEYGALVGESGGSANRPADEAEA